MTCRNESQYASCDEFICSECRIHLADWSRIEVETDDGKEWDIEYSFKYCPNCGRKVEK